MITVHEVAGGAVQHPGTTREQGGANMAQGGREACTRVNGQLQERGGQQVGER